MAATLWGKVYYQDHFAGLLRQEPGNRYVFSYDDAYLEANQPPIAHTLPLRKLPHINEDGLHPFFDNLVAEGWLRDAQARALGVRKSERFALLLAFGTDCAGAVTVIDPHPVHQVNIRLADPQDFAALASRASLSGIQPKLGVMQQGRRFRPAKAGEHSTHIAKMPSGGIQGIVENEYVTTLACRALLKGDTVVDVRLAPVKDVCDKALIVTRFDRSPTGERHHFEEFNQLLGKPSEDKYDGDYTDLAEFITTHPERCLRTDLDRLYRRILVCILTGNTDAHLKNFAMLHTDTGLRLTPAYDLVASGLYPEYQTLALGLNKARDLRLNDIKAKHIVRLGQDFQLPTPAITMAIDYLGKNIPRATKAVEKAKGISDLLKKQLIEQIQRRWNGTFASIGQYLSKKR